MANIFEIDMTLKDIDADPVRHNQVYWGIQVFDERGNVCGTAMCAAGFTVVRHGYRLDFDKGQAVAYRCEAPDGGYASIEHAAARILELSPAEAGSFFAACNTREDLQSLRDRFAEREAEREHSGVSQGQDTHS